MEQDRPALTARQEQGSRSRQEILDAAERLMGARGYTATSISALSKESGLPGSSIYWHFGSKSGVLGAVMERGSRQFFAQTDIGQIPLPEEPRERLTVLLRTSVTAIDANPRFLRLFIMLLLGSEGDHAQQEVVARVRSEGARLLREGLEFAYEPWGEEVAQRVGAELGDLALALFDGIFIAGQAAGRYDSALVDQTVTMMHTSAEMIRAAAVATRLALVTGPHAPSWPLPQERSSRCPWPGKSLADPKWSGRYRPDTASPTGQKGLGARQSAGASC